jgi:(S)-sulfolactate dehydrogenase
VSEIVITEFMDAAVVDELVRDRDVFYDKGLVDRPADLVREAARCRGLIVRNRTQVTAELLDQCPNLKVIGRLGVGLENIDMAACAARGIEVCPARGANAVSVAEYVIGTMLILMRGLHRTTAPVIAGEWPRNAFMGREAAGATFGLVGFGDIARHAAARASALGMEVIAHDPFVNEEDPVWREMRVRQVSLEDLLADADVVTLHIPLTDSTRDLIDGTAIARMKDDAILINSSRGAIVNEDALIAALKEGTLGGAALDVFADEPVTAESGARFQDVPNLILTPHIAGVTHQSNRWTSVLTVRNVLDFLKEEEIK